MIIGKVILTLLLFFYKNYLNFFVRTIPELNNNKKKKTDEQKFEYFRDRSLTFKFSSTISILI